MSLYSAMSASSLIAAPRPAGFFGSLAWGLGAPALGADLRLALRPATACNAHNSDLTELRVEPVAHPVTQDVQREHRDQDGDAREDRDPPRLLDQPPPIGHHHAPPPPRRRDPPTQKRESP